MIDLDGCKNIHCIGIGGIGLSAIAGVLLSRGYNVSGSDHAETKMTSLLAKQGAIIFNEHKAENVDNADLVIYSTAVPDDNPEMVRARELNIPTVTRSEILGLIMDEFPDSIAISGTHGKTTTTSMVSLIVDGAGLDPTIINGGNLDEFGGNFKIGKSPFFITEACEFKDGFLSLHPKYEVILNIDYDHLDYFGTIENVVKSFSHFADNRKQGGKVVAYADGNFVKQVTDLIPDAVTFGFDPECTYRVSNIEYGENGTPSFDMSKNGELLGRVELVIPGEHNVLNAAAAFACCHEMGIETEHILEGLHRYKGARRRFDIVGETKKGATLVDDYAHHPLEIAVTLEAATHFKYNKLWCVFQPFTYSRTKMLLDEFVESFTNADVIVLTQIMAGREKDEYGISSLDLLAATEKAYPDKEIYYCHTLEDVADKIIADAAKDDLVVSMGCGDVYKANEIILKKENN